MTSPENVTTPSATAKEKGCTTQAIYDALKRGDLTGFRVGESHIIVRDAKYEAYKPYDTGIRITRLKEDK